jgi:hypothetical protein
MRMLPDAYDTLTLDEIDAAIATFHDPLTADEVVALAQWWTLRAALVTVANEIPDTELSLMTLLGQEQAALRLVAMRDTEQKQWAGLIAMYKGNPACTEAHRRLYALVPAQTAHDDYTLRARLQQILRAELAVGRYELAQTAMRHLAWRFDAPVAGEVVLGMIEAQRLEAAYELILTMIELTQEAGNWREISHLMYQIAQTPAQEFCRVVLARLETAFTRRDRKLPVQPANIDYREAYLAGMWLGLTYLQLGQLEMAGKWLHDCDIVNARAYQLALVPACEIGSAQTTDPRIIVALARSLLRRKLNHVGIVCLISRLIQLNQPKRARELLPKIKINQDTLIPLVAVYDQLGDSAAGDALLDDHLPRLLKDAKESATATQCQDYAVHLIKIGRFASAVRVLSTARTISTYIQRALLVTTVSDYMPTPELMTHIIEQVEQWRQESPPAEPNRKWYEDQSYFIIRCARTLRQHQPEQARAWADHAGDWLAHIDGHARRDGVRLQFIRFYDESDDPQLTYAWLQTLERISETPSELYAVIRNNLTRHRTAFARSCFAMIQAKRPRLKRLILENEVQRALRAGIEHYRDFRQTGSTPDENTLLKYRLYAPTTLAQEWHMLPQQRLYEHLVMLTHAYPVLHAVEPDLYPRVLRACLDIVAQFAPEWAVQAQALVREL